MYFGSTRFTVYRVFLNSRRRVVWKANQTYEQALKHISDPETAWKTVRSPEALRYTDKHGEWFDILEREPGKKLRLPAWLKL